MPARSASQPARVDSPAVKAAKSVQSTVDTATETAEKAIASSVVGKMSQRERRFVLALGLGAFCCGMIVAEKLFRTAHPTTTTATFGPTAAPRPVFVDRPCPACQERKRAAEKLYLAAQEMVTRRQAGEDAGATTEAERNRIDPPPPVGIVDYDETPGPSETGS